MVSFFCIRATLSLKRLQGVQTSKLPSSTQLDRTFSIRVRVRVRVKWEVLGRTSGCELHAFILLSTLRPKGLLSEQGNQEEVE
jgi:hypothetical protein